MVSDFHFNKALEVLNRGVRVHYVYFALATSVADDPPLVKIGTTCDPVGRLSNLRRGGTTEAAWMQDRSRIKDISYVGLLVGDHELEKLLHRAFAAYRVGGEWFDFQPIDGSIFRILAGRCVCRGCEAGDVRAHI